MLLAIVALSMPWNMSTPPVCKNTVAPGANEPPLAMNVVSWLSVSAVVAPPTAALNVCCPVRAVSSSASVWFVLFQLAPARMLPVKTLPVFEVSAVVVSAVVVSAVVVSAVVVSVVVSAVVVSAVVVSAIVVSAIVVSAVVVSAVVVSAVVVSAPVAPCVWSAVLIPWLSTQSIVASSRL